MHDTITLHYVTLHCIAWYHTLGLCPIDICPCVVRITLHYMLLHYVCVCCCVVFSSSSRRNGLASQITYPPKVQMLRRNLRSWRRTSRSLRRPLVHALETDKKTLAVLECLCDQLRFPITRAREYILVYREGQDLGPPGSETLRSPDLGPRDLLPYLHDAQSLCNKTYDLLDVWWNTTLLHYITLHYIALHHNVVLRPIDLCHCIVSFVCCMCVDVCWCVNTPCCTWWIAGFTC